MADPATLVTNPDLTNAVVQINAFLSHVSLGAMTAHGLQWLKTRSSVSPVWNALSDRGKAWIGMALAFLGSLGITSAFHYDPQVGAVTAVFSGLTAASIGQHGWSFALSWVMQQGWYQQIIKPTVVVGPPAKPDAPTAVPVQVEVKP